MEIWEGELLLGKKQGEVNNGIYDLLLFSKCFFFFFSPHYFSLLEKNTFQVCHKVSFSQGPPL